MNKCNKLILSLFFSLIVVETFAETRLEIKKDVIQGNSELPKILYIIPWKLNSSKAKIQGVKLDNYYEKLLRPYHPYKVVIDAQN